MQDKFEVAIKADRVGSLIKWSDYFMRYPNYWETSNSARHFLVTRRAQMIKHGALFKTTKGLMVDPDVLDKLLPILIVTADQEQLDLPLDGHSEGGTK